MAIIRTNWSNASRGQFSQKTPHFRYTRQTEIWLLPKHAQSVYTLHKCIHCKTALLTHLAYYTVSVGRYLVDLPTLETRVYVMHKSYTAILSQVVYIGECMQNV